MRGAVRAARFRPAGLRRSGSALRSRAPSRDTRAAWPCRPGRDCSRRGWLLRERSPEDAPLRTAARLARTIGTIRVVSRRSVMRRAALPLRHSVDQPPRQRRSSRARTPRSIERRPPHAPLPSARIAGTRGAPLSPIFVQGAATSSSGRGADGPIVSSSATPDVASSGGDRAGRAAGTPGRQPEVRRRLTSTNETACRDSSRRSFEGSCAVDVSQAG